jgi:hypothetical protein
MLGDFVARFLTYARGLPRSLSDHGSGTSSLAPRPTLGDCLDHSPTTARGLPRSLSDHGSGTLRLNYMRLATCIQLGYSFALRPCYKAHTSPSSKLGDYIGTMHLPVHLVSLVRRLGSQLNWEFFLDPGTTCLRHLLPGSGTKWAHFTLRWMCLFFDLYASDDQGRSRTLRFKTHLHFFSEIQVGTLYRTEIFFFLLKSTIHSSDNLLLQRQRWSEMSRTQASLFGEG